MAPLGSACLTIALAAALFAIGAALYGARSGDRRFVEASRRAIYSFAGLMIVAVVILEAAFLRSDFSFELVAGHSSTTTPTFYKATAMWGSQGGSLLLWAFVLGIAASIALRVTRFKHREIVPYATAVLAGLGVFFCGLMLIAGGANPFAQLNPAPAEGVGLNPLLRHPAMMVHPPMLYSGYVAFSIPFAFAIGALITRRLDASWIRSTRRFALVAWLFLGTGILLGSYWSYNELGWGGYWGWDPVENASLMPWLIGTAFLHSVMVQERRGMLKLWNVSLIVAAFTLALVGTFLVRSGILQSIHAFGDSTVGGPLLGLIAAVVLGSAYLIATRLSDLRSERRLDSVASRESIFLVNNLLLVGLCVVIFWGTFFPLISEAFTGTRSSLAAPWFDDYTTPLGIVLVLFTGIGPLIAWRRMSWEGIRRVLWRPLLVALVATILLVALAGAGSEPMALVLFAFAAFSLAALIQEFAQAVGTRRALAGGSIPVALAAVVARNRRRYGGYIVHSGIVLLFIAVAASSSFKQTTDFVLDQPGDSGTLGDYEVTYVGASADVDYEENKLVIGALIEVTKDGEPFATLNPERHYHAPSGQAAGAASGPISGFFEGEVTSEVGRKGGVGSDLWMAMQPDLTKLEPVIAKADRDFIELARGFGADSTDEIGSLSRQEVDSLAFAREFARAALAKRFVDEGAPINLRVNVNPLVIWIWLGGAVALLGALIAVWPAPLGRRRAVSDVQAARLARELARST